MSRILPGQFLAGNLPTLILACIGMVTCGWIVGTGIGKTRNRIERAMLIRESEIREDSVWPPGSRAIRDDEDALQVIRRLRAEDDARARRRRGIFRSGSGSAR